MALTDEEKLRISVAAIVGRLNEFEEWSVFVTFLQNLEKSQIKTFLINTLQEAQVTKDAQLVLLQTEKDDLIALESEIDSTV